MECNREEALRAKEIAERKMQLGEYISAQKFLLKAQGLFPNLDNISQLTAVCEVHCAAQNKINGFDNWYGILQVEQTADETAIRKQYRKLALLLHPDKNKFAGAEAAFKLVGEANRLLSDQAKRSQYDDDRCRDVSRGYVSKPVPSPPKTNAGTPNESENNVKSPAMNQKAPQLDFWTHCQFCLFRYKYSREYLNRILHCLNCRRKFVAYDVSKPVRTKLQTNVGTKPGMNQMAPHLGFWTRCQFCLARYKCLREHVNRIVHCPNCNNSFIAYDVCSPKPVPVFCRKRVSAEAEIGKTVTSEEKLSRKDIKGCKNDVGDCAPGSDRGAAEPSQSQLDFWTQCQFCLIRYKFLREYVYRMLLCQNCNKPYIAYDVGFEGLPPYPKPRGVSTKAETGKEDVERCAAKPCSQVNESKPAAAKPHPEVKQPEPCAAKSQYEETTPKPSITRSKLPERKRKPDVATTDATSSPSRSRKKFCSGDSKKNLEKGKEAHKHYSQPSQADVAWNASKYFNCDPTSSSSSQDL